MAYFTQDFIDFFEELSQNNNKEWFDANRKRYKKSVKDPFNAFIQDLIEQVQKDDPQVLILPKDAIFRINRDIRFSKDKTPYKTHMAAIVSRGGRKDKSRPGMYVHLNHEQIGLGGGSYFCNTKILKQIREEITYNMEEFDEILNAKAFKDKFGELKGEKNKRLPKELTELAKKQPLLFNKQFFYFGYLPSQKLLSSNLMEEVMSFYDAGKPMQQFLAKAFD